MRPWVLLPILTFLLLIIRNIDTKSPLEKGVLLKSCDFRAVMKPGLLNYIISMEIQNETNNSIQQNNKTIQAILFMLL